MPAGTVISGFAIQGTTSGSQAKVYVDDVSWLAVGMLVMLWYTAGVVPVVW